MLLCAEGGVYHKAFDIAMSRGCLDFLTVWMVFFELSFNQAAFLDEIQRVCVSSVG